MVYIRITLATLIQCSHIIICLKDASQTIVFKKDTFVNLIEKISLLKIIKVLKKLPIIYKISPIKPMILYPACEKIAVFMVKVVYQN